jgi:hypothetical protein
MQAEPHDCLDVDVTLQTEALRPERIPQI